MQLSKYYYCEQPLHPCPTQVRYIVPIARYHSCAFQDHMEDSNPKPVFIKISNSSASNNKV